MAKRYKSQNRQYNGQTKQDNDVNHRTQYNGQMKQDKDINHRTDNTMAKQTRTDINHRTDNMPNETMAKRNRTMM